MESEAGTSHCAFILVLSCLLSHLRLTEVRLRYYFSSSIGNMHFASICFFFFFFFFKEASAVFFFFLRRHLQYFFFFKEASAVFSNRVDCF